MQRTEFARVTPETVGIHSKAIEKLLDELESGFTEMHGIMIMRHGKVCAEGWWSPYAPGLRHGLQSLSKTYAATATGIAYTEGILRLEDKIIDIFPEEAPKEPSENLKRLTVRDVLCMGCGMDEMPQPTSNWICDFLATPVTHVPGTTYMYNSMGSTLLGAIVRKLTGEGLQEYLKPRLFDKIGIDADNLRWALMPDGMEIGGGGLLATTEDNLRLMKLYADGGVWDGQRILAEDYVRKAVSLQNESATEAIGNPQATDNFVGYGFQIWMCRPQGVYRADGAMGQFSIVVPDKDMIISINESATGAHWAQKTLDTVWEFLNEVDDEKAICENPGAAAHLANRLRHLTLPSPMFAPYDSIEKRVSGKKFAVSEGRICLENEIMHMMSGAKLSSGLQSFSFDFSCGTCEMHYVQDALPHQVYISMDGTRYLNEMNEAGSPVSKLYLNGYWKEQGTFSVIARWIETCFEKEIDFTFSDTEVTICESPTVGGFGPASWGNGQSCATAKLI